MKNYKFIWEKISQIMQYEKISLIQNWIIKNCSYPEKIKQYRNDEKNTIKTYFVNKKNSPLFSFSDKVIFYYPLIYMHVDIRIELFFYEFLKRMYFNMIYHCTG